MRGSPSTRRCEALEEGGMIVLHPEGTVTRDPDGWPMIGKTGAARLALLAPDVPVIPVAQWGVQKQIDLYRKKVKLFPRPRHTLSVGEPIDLSAFHGRASRRRDAARGYRSDHAPAAHGRRRAARRAGAHRPAVPLASARSEGRRPRRGELGHHLREGAGRRGQRGHLVGAPAVVAEAIEQTHVNPDYLPGIELPDLLARHARPRPGAARRRAGRDRRHLAVAAREPGELGAAAAARRRA